MLSERLRGLHQGLKEAGYIGGENVAIEYRWAEGEYDRLPRLALELVRREVSVIITGANAATIAAIARTPGSAGSFSWLRSHGLDAAFAVAASTPVGLVLEKWRSKFQVKKRFSIVFRAEPTARDEAIIRQNENPARALVEAQCGVSGTLMANVI